MKAAGTDNEGRADGKRPVFGHLPVLLEEVLVALQVEKGGRFLDGTFGGGGHARAILEGNAENRLVAIDRDPRAARRAEGLRVDFGDRFQFLAGEFSELLGEMEEPFDGILLDLGVSSYQLDEGERGFSFREEAALDMRMDDSRGISAAEFLETAPESQLVQAIRDFGEEQSWRRVVAAVLQARGTGQLGTTTGFSSLIESVIGTRPVRGRRPIHPATRSFQGVRIAVNDELGVLERALPLAFERLKEGGRLGVISFHSLEDRMVKRFFRTMAGRPEHRGDSRCQDERLVRGSMPFSKPVVANDAELESNPRARSARFRVLIREDGGGR